MHRAVSDAPERASLVDAEKRRRTRDVVVRQRVDERLRGAQSSGQRQPIEVSGQLRFRGGAQPQGLELGRGEPEPRRVEHVSQKPVPHRLLDQRLRAPRLRRRQRRAAVHQAPQAQELLHRSGRVPRRRRGGGCRRRGTETRARGTAPGCARRIRGEDSESRRRGIVDASRFRARCRVGWRLLGGLQKRGGTHAWPRREPRPPRRTRPCPTARGRAARCARSSRKSPCVCLKSERRSETPHSRGPCNKQPRSLSRVDVHRPRPVLDVLRRGRRRREHRRLVGVLFRARNPNPSPHLPAAARAGCSTRSQPSAARSATDASDGDPPYAFLVSTRRPPAPRARDGPHSSRRAIRRTPTRPAVRHRQTRRRRTRRSCATVSRETRRFLRTLASAKKRSGLLLTSNPAERRRLRRERLRIANVSRRRETRFAKARMATRSSSSTSKNGFERERALSVKASLTDISDRSASRATRARGATPR